MRFEIEVHKHAEKAFKKAPVKIKKKIYRCLNHFGNFGLHNLPYPIKKLQGSFRKFDYFEVLLDKDYRIIFRLGEKNIFYIRDAGTHNGLGTG